MKFKSLATAFLVCSIFLSACGSNNISSSSSSSSSTPSSSQEHIHTYSDTYNYDEQSHWHPSTCGHNDSVVKEKHHFQESVTPATYENDGYTTHTCTICGYSYKDNYIHHEDLVFEITWANYNGDLLKTDYVKNGDIPAYDGNTPTRPEEGEYQFVFIGWDREVTAAQGDTTYFASFKKEKRKFPIHWVDEEKHEYETTYCEYGDIPEYSGTTPTKDKTAEYSYTFDRWEPNVRPVDGEQYYVAKFNQEENIYNVTWKDDEGNILKEEKYPCHAIPNYGDANPEKDSDDYYNYYEFKGWDKEITEVLEDVTYTATFNSLPSFTFVESSAAYGYDLVSVNNKKIKELNISKHNGYDVVEIYKGALKDLNQLESLSISVTGQTTNSYFLGQLFGASKYQDNKKYVPASLKTVSLHRTQKISAYAFYGLSNITTINLDSDLKNIGQEAFNGCSGLSNFYIPSGVSYIGEGAFYNCSSISSFEVDEASKYYCSDGGVLFTANKNTLISYPANKLDEEYVIPNEVSSVAKDAFANAKFKTLTISFIGGSKAANTKFTYAVRNAKNLKTVILSPSDDYTVIPEFAFEYANIEEVVIPDTIKEIGRYAFYSSGIKRITIPSSVEIIGVGVFSECHLSSLTLPFLGRTVSEPKPLGYLFNSTYGSQGNYAPVTLKEVTILNGGDTLVQYAFYKCNNIQTITLPKTITKIDYCAFQNCSSLVTVNNLENVERVENYAFLSCSSLSNISLGDSLSAIGDSVFSGCASLDNVYLGDKARISYSTFYGCTSLSNIEIGPNNTALKYEDGVLYSDKNLMFYTYTKEDKSFTVPSFVSTIYGIRNDHLEELVIPNNVKAIFSPALRTPNLVSLTIPFVGQSCNTAGSLAEIFSSKYDDADERKANLPPNLKTVTVLEGCTEIGSFESFYSLETIYLPATINNEFAGGCFKNCENLTEIIFSKDNNVYQSIDGIVYSKDGTVLIYCPCKTKVQELTIPEGVEIIGYEAFRNNTSVTKVTMPSTLTKVESFAFDNASGLVYLDFNDAAATLNQSSFGNCSSLTTVDFKNKFKSIGLTSFANCDSLVEIDIPASVSTIGSNAFSGCASLTKVTFHEGLETIEGQAFSYCKSIKEVTIPKDVTVKTYAFLGCEGIKKVYIDEGVILDYGAFISCKNITEAYIDATIVGEAAFNDCRILENVTFGSHVETLKRGIFAYNGSMTSLVIPATVKYMETGVFYDIYYLKYLEIPYVGKSIDEPTSIGSLYDSEFHKSLEKIVVTEGCHTIGQYAFSNLKSVKTIVLPQSIQTLNEKCVYSCPKLETLYLPFVGTTRSNTSKFANIVTSSNSIRKLILPKDISKIGDNTFDVYFNANILYGGSQDDFAKVTLGDQSGVTISNLFFYSEEAPQTSGNYWHYVKGEPVYW